MGRIWTVAGQYAASAWHLAITSVNSAGPLLSIGKDGVLVAEKSGLDSFISIAQFNSKQLYGLDMQVLNGDQQVIKLNSGAVNFFVGLILISMLANKKRSMAATTSN